MREVEALLEKVPPDSLDAAAAKQLLTRIREGSGPVRQADQERAKIWPRPASHRPSRGVRHPNPQHLAHARRPPGSGRCRNAVPGVPTARMSTRDFNRYFGDCSSPRDRWRVNGKGHQDSFAMADQARCRQALPTLVNSVILADSQGGAGRGPKSALQRTLPDGGAPPAPPDAGG